jgi:hypothetical protein
MLFDALPLFSQVVTISNTKVTIAPGTVVKIAGGLTCRDTTIFENYGNIKIEGDLKLINVNEGTDFFTIGNFEFNGKTQQNIIGTKKPKFFNLTVNNSNGLFFRQDALISNQLNFLNGKIFTGGNTLQFSFEPANTLGRYLNFIGFDEMKYIVTSKSGHVRLVCDTSLTDLFVPIGDAYAPVTLSVNGVSGGQVNIDLYTDVGTNPHENTPTPYSSGIEPDKRCDHYWTMKKSGSGNFTSYSIIFDLTFTNNTGDISKYIVRRFDTLNGWITQNSEVIGNTLVVNETDGWGDGDCDFVIGEPAVQKIFLQSGWNMSSSFRTPFSPDSMEYVCADVNESLVMAKNNFGGVYIPSYEINTIGKWDVTQGYQIYMTNDDTLVVKGLAVNPENTPIQLTSGWNMPAYLRNQPMDAVIAFASITDDENLIIAKDNDGKVYIPMFEINDIGNLKPGQGYLVYVSNNDNLIYPANLLGKTSSSVRNNIPKHLISKYKKTGSNSTLILKIALTDGSEIGVYNLKDEMVGSGVVNNNIAAITIWGDNTQTDEIDGALSNAELRIKNYELNTGLITDVKLTDLTDFITKEKVADLKYSKDKVYFAKAENFGNSQISLGVKPNPAKTVIEIEFTTTDCKNTEINIYSTDGKLKDNITNLSGNSTIYDVSNFTSGEYTVILTCGNEKAMSKVMVVK